MKKDIFGDDIDVKTTDFGQLLAASEGKLSTKLKVGDKIKGEVLTLGKDESFISTGTPIDGILLTSELKDKTGELTVKVGDTVEVFVTQVKGTDVRLSTKPTSKNLAEDLEDAFDTMQPVEGKITEVVNGGYRVQVLGKLAFCPFSQIDTRKIESPEALVGKKFEFLITQFEKSGRNIVLSRRKLLDERKAEGEGAFLQTHKEGDLVNGTITRIEAYGLFVDIGDGVEGMCHISEASWSRIDNLNDFFTVESPVECKILKIEDLGKNLKISLSIKQASAQPWENFPSHIRAGEIIEAKITRCMKFGAFAEVAPGIEGLIPLGEMSYFKRINRAEDVVTPGTKVRVKVKEINPNERRLSLSLRDAEGDPWALIAQKYAPGTKVTGTIDKKEPFGIFVVIEPGITGLLPKSVMSASAEGKEYESKRPGDTVTLKVARIDSTERKMSLTLPSSEDDIDWKSNAPQANKSLGSLASALNQALNKPKK